MSDAGDGKPEGGLFVFEPVDFAFADCCNEASEVMFGDLDGVGLVIEILEGNVNH